MFHDIQNTIHLKTALTGTSTDAYDTGKVGGCDISIGGKTGVSALVVPTTLAGAGALVVEVIQSATSNLASPTVLASKSFTLAVTDVNKMLEIPIPQGSISQRYIGVQFSGAASIAGNLGNVYFVPTAEVPVSDKHFAKVYPSL